MIRLAVICLIVFAGCSRTEYKPQPKPWPTWRKDLDRLGAHLCYGRLREQFWSDLQMRGRRAEAVAIRP